MTEDSDSASCATAQEGSPDRAETEYAFEAEDRVTPSMRLFSEVDDRLDDYKRARVSATSLVGFGHNAKSDFFEVCVGSETLSQAGRLRS